MDKISTKQFAILVDNPPVDELTLGIENNIKISASTKHVAFETSFIFEKEYEKVMKLAVLCEFEINSEDWDAQTKNKVTTIPKGTLDYLMAQVVGVARGVLHCKTEGTSCGNIILPPLNVSNIIDGDLVLDLNKQSVTLQSPQQS